MKFAIQHAIGDPNWVPEEITPANLAAWCRTAESSGWDAIAFTDHPAPTGPWIDNGGEGVIDPFSSLGFCAAVTSSVRLLTFVLVPAYRNPFQVAQQVSSLDRLSGGRLTVGLGTGYLFGEFRALGVAPDDRLSRFDTYVDLMRRGWSGEEVSVETDFFSAKRVRVLPPVVQSPHPPLWIHGNSSFGLTRAARYADGWLAMMTSGVLAKTTRTRPIPDLATLAERIEAIRIAAAAEGRPPGQPEIIVAGAWPMLDVRSAPDPDMYFARIAALRALGVDWTVSLCCGDDPGAARDTVAWFGEGIVRPSGIAPEQTDPTPPTSI
jgi:probable F420-dependent oxidoreductase